MGGQVSRRCFAGRCGEDSFYCQGERRLKDCGEVTHVELQSVMVEFTVKIYVTEGTGSIRQRYPQSPELIGTGGVVAHESDFSPRPIQIAVTNDCALLTAISRQSVYGMLDHFRLTVTE